MLDRETPSPHWVVARGASPAAELRSREPRFLIHQARFHVGDTLWLTPLLRALHRRFPGVRATVVGPACAPEVLAGSPYAAEVLVYPPDGGAGERRRVLDALAGRRFDAAIFGFARRPESRWLAQALSEQGVPERINLEYFDPELDHREVWEWATREAWFVWGTMPSPRMLLHALDPFRRPGESALDDDRRVEFRPPESCRRQAREVLAGLGLADGPLVVLTPGGRSSERWPAAKFAELAARLAAGPGVGVLLAGAPDEERLLRQIRGRAAGLAAAARGRIAVSVDSLGELAAILAGARLLVSNDSAPIHFAEAMGTPTLYFAEREKLLHSRPAGEACWALFDEEQNAVARIPVERAMAAIREMERCGMIRLGR